MFTVRYSTCVIHEVVYVSEDLKTTSCRDCNLRPKGSVKTKACSSTRLLIWVHIWEAGSQTLTAASPRGVWTNECVVTGLTGGKVLKPGAAVTSSSRSGVSISHNVSLVETCWKSVQGYLSVHSKWKGYCFFLSVIKKMCDKNSFLGGTRAKPQLLWQQNDLWQLKEFCFDGFTEIWSLLKQFSIRISVILWSGDNRYGWWLWGYNADKMRITNFTSYLTLTC